VIEALKSRNVFLKKASDIQYYTRCPYCGDSRKNIHTGHFYIRINPNDNLPIVYHCFKCPAEGIFDKETAEMLDLNLDMDSLEYIKTFNKTSDKFSSANSNVKELTFDFKLPDHYDLPKIRYVENRIGKYFSDQELKDIKIITSLREFLIANNLTTITCKPQFARLLEDKYVGFLSNNNAYILFRDITDREKMRWYKYPIVEDARGQKIFYSMTSEVDLFTEEKITINLSEGVIDAISIAYNVNDSNENTLNIAVCGKFYAGVLRHLVGLGIFGDNVAVNIFSDNDKTDDTSIDFYRRTLSRFTCLMKEINVYYNTKSKDCGVPKDQISLRREKL
jgi:hypothetical protein